MSVLVSAELPTIDTSIGGVDVRALGGNGFISAHSVMRARVVAPGDASGGTLEARLRMDPRYCCLISHVMCSVQGQTAAVPVDMAILESSNSVTAVRAQVQLRDTGTLTTGITTWSPDPMVLSADSAADPSAEPVVRVQIPNDSALTCILFAHVFAFDKRAREVVPLDVITNVLHRSTNVICD